MTRVTNDGLQNLNDLTSLIALDLTGTATGDEGLKYLNRMANLDSLMLTSTRVTDAGLTTLTALRNIKRLSLNATQISDTALGTLAALPSLRMLLIADTPHISDLGLFHLKAFKKLETLSLEDEGHTRTSPITGAGLSELGTISTLQHLSLNGESDHRRRCPASSKSDTPKFFELGRHAANRCRTRRTYEFEGPSNTGVARHRCFRCWASASPCVSEPDSLDAQRPTDY